MKPPEQAPPSRPPAPVHERDLDDAEFGELANLLAGIPEPLEPLALDEADGYVAAIAVQPVAIAPDAWLRFVFDAGGHRWGESTPSAEQLRARELLLRREAAIRRSLAEFGGFDPWLADAEEDPDPIAGSIAPWAGGFVAALELFPPELPAQAVDAVDAAVARLARWLEPEVADRPASFDHAVAELVEAVAAVYEVTEAERYRVPTQRRAEPKVGRNDPCPCGSGRKFKQCHGRG